MSKLFQKAKLAVKFRKAGEGHSLSESSTPSTSSQSQAQQQPRKAPSSDAERAGQAALERLQVQEKQTKPPKSARATWKTNANEPSSSSEMVKNIGKLKHEVDKADMEREKASSGFQRTMSTEKEVVKQETAPDLAVSGVYLKCPFCSSSYLRREVRNHMEECLTKSLEDDQTLTPTIMIKTINKDQVKVKSCVDVLVRYMDNILQNPDEEKYRKIKQGNKVFQERVRPIKGTVEFLLSCGFVEKPLPDNSGEMCFILEEVNADALEKLMVMKEVLLGTEPLKPTLDRSLKVLRPSPNSEILELTDDFFELRSDEVKRIHTERSNETERNSQLRTREMRENEGKNAGRIYRFTLLRVRFPDGIILQGTFHAREKASTLISFVREQLQSDWLPFVLSEPGGGQCSLQEELSFAELGLVPAAILNFAWDATVMADIVATGTSFIRSSYLKPELLSDLEHTKQS